MIKAVLFDFDGTLIDTNNLIFESYRHTYKTYFDKDITKDYFKSCYGKPLMEAFSENHDEESIMSLTQKRTIHW